MATATRREVRRGVLLHCRTYVRLRNAAGDVLATIDACAMLVSGLRLGLPGEENDLFEKLARRGVISEGMTGTLRRMKEMRSLLVHEYG